VTHKRGECPAPLKTKRRALCGARRFVCVADFRG
jgi:hypothetical protein